MSLTCLRTASWTLFLLVLESWWGHRPGWGSCLWGGQAAVSSGAGVTLLHDFGPQMPHCSVALALPAGLLGGPKSPSHGPRLAAKAQVLCTVRHPREWHQGPVLPCLATRRERKVSFNSGTICFITFQLSGYSSADDLQQHSWIACQKERKLWTQNHRHKYLIKRIL